MGVKANFRWHFIYSILYVWTFIAHRLYYRRITVVGLEKIPADTPVIYAPNHQNALMDPLAVAFAARRQLAFLARADIFQKPAVARLLNMLQILPIYRIRDGIQALGRNQEVFDQTVNVLKSNIPICILPEGNHEGQKRLRPLKKGIFRIAFQAEESHAFKLNIHVIPVGVDYSDYFNAGSDLTVVFGTPIRIADYEAQYRENEQRTINTLMNTLAEGMRSVMIHIPEEHYKVSLQISEMFEPNVWNTLNIKRHQYNKLTIKQYIIQKVTEAFGKNQEKATEISTALDAYTAKLNKLKLKDCLLQQKFCHFLRLLIETLLSIVLLPVYFYGLILNYIPFKVPVKVADKIKDQHFKSSIHFGISLFLFPIYYLIIFTVFCIFSKSLTLSMVFGVTLPLSGYFAFYNFQRMKRLLGKLRLFKLRYTNPEQYNALIQERNQIIDTIKATINS